MLINFLIFHIHASLLAFSFYLIVGVTHDLRKSSSIIKFCADLVDQPGSVGV